MNRKRSSKLTVSSRVSDRVLEYYMKFGQARDLEKFMRICSPNASPHSSIASQSCSSSDEWALQGNLSQLFNEQLEPITSNSKAASGSKSMSANLSADSAPQEHLIPIILEKSADCENEEASAKHQPTTAIVESPKTPLSRAQSSETKQTQTPESVTKSHKRLEWDSLADVGYKKSKSTSNVSIVERMLLREFFEVSSNVGKGPNSSESDIRLLEQEIAELGTLKKQFQKSSGDRHNYDTPPLASSTQVEARSSSGSSAKKSADKQPKLTTIGTNTTTLPQKREQFAQTSYKQPRMVPQEVQVAFSSASVSPMLGSSAEPSSFEYHSRNSRRSSDNQSSQSANRYEPTQSSSRQQKDNETHPFVRGLNEMFAQRKAREKQHKVETLDDDDRLRKLFAAWNTINADNKENDSSSSTSGSTANASTSMIDLGIQLICALMKTKCVDERKKKRLVRFVVKSITHGANASELNMIVCKTASFIGGKVPDNDMKQVTSYTKKHPSIEVVLDKSNVKNISSKSDSLASTRVENTATAIPLPPSQKATTQPTSRENTQIEQVNIGAGDAKQNKNIKGVYAILQPYSSSTVSPQTMSSSITCTTTTFFSTTPPTSREKIDIAKKPMSPKKSSELKQTKSTISATVATSSGTEKEQIKIPTSATIPPLSGTERKQTKSKTSTTSSSTEMYQTTTTTSATIATSSSTAEKQTKTTSSTATATQSSTATSSSSSKDVITQKPVITSKSTSPHDATDAEVATIQEWMNPLTQSEVEYEDKKHPTKVNKPTKLRGAERKEHLNWIECEIERLQNLRKLLLKDETITTSDTSVGSQQQQRVTAPISKPKQASEKLYDTVYSEQSKSTTSKSDSECVIKELEEVISGSKQDIAELQQKLQAKQSKSDSQKSKGKHIKTQRSKMDTPPDSIESESVCSFVRQRKQEFLVHYKTRKLKHYDEMLDSLNERPTTSRVAAARNVGHSSVPQQTMEPPIRVYYTYPPTQQAQQDNWHNGSWPAPPQTAPPMRSTKTARFQFDDPVAAALQQPHASSSAFCVSSELSVPMGYGASSSPTTTHQYDDVATAAAFATDTIFQNNISVQTGPSLRRTQPIYETRKASPYRQQHRPCNQYTYAFTSTRAASACVQVRPKAIAYTLHFKAKPRTKPDGDSSSSNDSGCEAEEFQTLDKRTAPSIQEALKHKRPEFLEQANQRTSILGRIQKLRQEREQELRDIADENSSLSSLDNKLYQRLPPPVTERVRIFPTKQMKAITKKRFVKLPEVVARKEREREERRQRSNRLLREVFNRRLQQRVRKGQLSINHSHTLI